MTRIKWSEASRFELASIDDKLVLRDAEIADRFIKAAVEAGHFLSEHPRAGPYFNSTFLRKWRVPGTPYLLIYRVHQDTVHILHVMHDRSDWQSL